MDLNKIFIENACPAKVGGQAILEGLMMRGSRAIAIAMREPNGNIHLTVEPAPKKSKWSKLPIVRGVISFVSSLVSGTGILLYSAEVLEKLQEEQLPSEDESIVEEDKFDAFLKKHFDEKTALNITLYTSVILALVLVVGIFIILPTWLINLIRNAGLESVILLNLFEGLIRISMFVVYVSLISRMKDIKTVFQYHGAEHKTIHCYENSLELTAENAQSFYTLHPRCGTSFLMFVMVISLLVFSLFGWPDLKTRIISRLVLIPVIAGLSYELLQFTGRHDSKFVKILSMPGILLQKLTTAEPELDQLEVAIAAMKAVLVSQNDEEAQVNFEVGHILKDGSYEKDEKATSELIERKNK